MVALTQVADPHPEANPSPPSKPLEVLFIMPRLSFLRFFQSTLDLMIERGFNVRLMLESPRRDSTEQQWLADAEKRPNFVCETLNHFRSDPLRDRRIALRVGMEYVRRMGPAYSNRVAGLPRARLSRAPAVVRHLAKMPLLRTPRGLRALYTVLAAVDRTLPSSVDAVAYVERVHPDVIAVCDKGHPGSLSSAYVKAAQERGIPTALCVASWDNLTNRQRTRVAPHALLVWNDRQRQEAIDFHGIPAARVAITGAPRFDEWFSWKARARGDFLPRVGLDPSKPVILWIGGALNHSEITEAEYVSTWITAVRSSNDPILREAGVLVRPHPERLSEWSQADYSAFSNVAVWPREGMTFPIDQESKADYYDSIFHAGAVVGINSSAMIEASIVGRPVLTLLVPEFHDSQRATFHFAYLVESEGGPVQVAQSMEEHLTDLSAAIAGQDAGTSERAERFVADFVRPQGLERPATQIFVETLESLAQAPVQPDRDPWWIFPFRALVVLLIRVDSVFSLSRRALRRKDGRLLARILRLPRVVQRRTKKLRKRTRRLAERSRQLPATARRRRRRLRKWIQRRRRRYGRAILLRLPGEAERVRGARYEGFRELAQSRPAQAQPGAVEEDVRPPDEPVGS